MTKKEKTELKLNVIEVQNGGAYYVTGRNRLHLTCDSAGGSPPGGGGGGPSDDSGLLSGASIKQLEIPLALRPAREHCL